MFLGDFLLLGLLCLAPLMSDCFRINGHSPNQTDVAVGSDMRIWCSTDEDYGSCTWIHSIVGYCISNFKSLNQFGTHVNCHSDDYIEIYEPAVPASSASGSRIAVWTDYESNECGIDIR